MDAKLSRVEVVHSGPVLVLVHARLRVGHALAQRTHEADRWIAATALRLGVPLVSDDQIFQEVPGLTLEAASGPTEWFTRLGSAGRFEQ